MSPATWPPCSGAAFLPEARNSGPKTRLSSCSSLLNRPSWLASRSRSMLLLLMFPGDRTFSAPSRNSPGVASRLEQAGRHKTGYRRKDCQAAADTHLVLRRSAPAAALVQARGRWCRSKCCPTARGPPQSVPPLRWPCRGWWGPAGGHAAPAPAACMPMKGRKGVIHTSTRLNTSMSG
jgi:hypothetical protein